MAIFQVKLSEAGVVTAPFVEAECCVVAGVAEDDPAQLRAVQRFDLQHRYLVVVRADAFGSSSVGCEAAHSAAG